MKNVSYKTIAQSVYRTYTGAQGIVKTELVCLCVDIIEADKIKAALTCHVDFFKASRDVLEEMDKINVGDNGDQAKERLRSIVNTAFELF